MKLLIVEDDEANIALFQRELLKQPNIEVVYAKSRNSALEIIETNNFDLAVLDLNIPTMDDALDGDTSFGLEVYSRVRDALGIIPIFIFSGFGTVPIVSRFLNESDNHDFLGNRKPFQRTKFFEKNDFIDCLKAIKQVSSELNLIDSIEISKGTSLFDLNTYEARVLRLFARLYSGSMVRVSKLGGGLSSAKTFKVEVFNDAMTVQSIAVAKIGSVSLLDGENLGYDRHVKPILSVGCFPPVIEYIKAGAGTYGGLFYSLASDHLTCLTDVLKIDSGRALAIVKKLKAMLSRWQGGNIIPVSVVSIRQALVEDDVLVKHESKFGFDFRKIDALTVRIRESPQHCDLHGLNVLLSGSDEPLLIDFGEVRMAPSSLDPIIMELSLLFHPGTSAAWGGWPSDDQAKQWDDIDVFTADCPLQEYIKYVRTWGMETSGGDAGFYATAWAFSLRQLKYKDTNHALAIAVANACAHRLMVR